LREHNQATHLANIDNSIIHHFGSKSMPKQSLFSAKESRESGFCRILGIGRPFLAFFLTIIDNTGYNSMDFSGLGGDWNREN
ncbi:MAG: hypothetical protein JSV16_17295, partial [Candidatus Hydrogenedentota bacterium]